MAGAIHAAGSPALAGRALRVLAELGVIEDGEGPGELRVRSSERTELERSGTYRAWRARLEEARLALSSMPAAA